MKRYKVTYRTVDGTVWDVVIKADRFETKNAYTAIFYQGREKVAWFYAVKAIWEEVE